MADQPKSFSEYIKGVKSGKITATGPNPIQKRAFVPGGAGAAGSSNPQDPLSWVVDILSRPLYAVTETADSALEMGADADKAREKFEAGDGMGALGEVLGSIGKNATAGVRGFLSTSPDDKRTTSDLIEKGTDTIAPRFDENYVDTEDNVNPVLKGALGFVGDVALDPSTYLTLGVGPALKAGTTILKGAKAGLDAAKGSSVVTKAAEGAKSASDALAEALSKGKAARGAADERIAADDAARIAPETPPAAAGAAENAADDILPTPKAPEAAEAPEPDSLGSLLQASARTPKARETLKALREPAPPKPTLPTAPVAQAAEEVGEEMEALTYKAWQSDLVTRMKANDPELPPTVAVKVDGGRVVNVPFGKALAAARGETGSPATVNSAKQAFAQMYSEYAAKAVEAPPVISAAAAATGDRALTEAHRRLIRALEDTSDSAGYRVDLDDIDEVDEDWLFDQGYLGDDEALEGSFILTEKGIEAAEALSKVPETAAPKITPVESVATVLARRVEAQGIKQEELEMALGSDLLRQLSLYDNEANFTKTVDGLFALLEQTGHLDDIDLAKVTGALKLTKRLGIEDAPGVQQAHREWVAQATPRYETGEDALTAIREASEEAVDWNDPVSVGRHDAASVLPGFITKNLRDLDEYVTATDTDVLRTAEKMGEGLGRDRLAVNTHAQWDLFKRVQMHVRKRIESEHKSGNKRYWRAKQNAIMAQTFKAMKEAENFLEKAGVPIHIDYDGVRVPIKFSELYETLAIQDLDLMRRLFNNPYTVASQTGLLEAVAARVAKNVEPEDLDDILANVTKRNGKVDGKPIPNFLEHTGEETWGKVDWQPKARRQTEPPAAPEGYRWTMAEAKNGWHLELSNDEARFMLVNAITRASLDLAEIAGRNAEAYALRFQEDVTRMSEEVADELIALAEDPTRIGELLGTIVRTDKEVERIAKDISARKDATAVTQVATKASLDPAVRETAETLNSVARAQAKDLGANQAAREGITNQATREAEQLTDDVLAEGGHPDVDLTNPIARETEEIAVGINNTRLKLLHSANKALNGAAGLRSSKLDAFDWKRSSGTIMANMLRDSVGHINGIAAKYNGVRGGVKDIDAAFTALRAGSRPADAVLGAAYDDLERFMARYVDLSGQGGILGNVFFRSGAGLQYMDDIFRSYKILGDPTKLPDGSKWADSLIDIGKAEEAVAAGRYSNVVNAVMDQWREWPVEDSLLFLKRMDAAALRMATDVGIADSFKKYGLKHGFVSKEAESGWKAFDPEGKTRLGKLLGNDVYVAKEESDLLYRLDEVLSESHSIPGSIGDFIHNYFDPTLQGWKYAITQPRPGHHIRNLIGDESMTFMADGVAFQKQSTKDAFQLLKMAKEYRQGDVYTVDMLKALESLGDYRQVARGTTISNGKYGEISSGTVIDAMNRHGLLVDADVVEDLYEGATEGGAFSRVVKKVTLQGGRIQKTVSTVSEARDHFTRTKHFMQILHKAQKTGKDHLGRPLKTQDDLFDYAAKRVMKYHPDVTMLSNFERKYARRIIPFYTWMRGALPAMVESVLQNPARVNAFNKASYNTAVAMGLNPDSLSDPFPTDQLFPSFLTEQMQGPQFELGGNYYTVSPGLSSWDLFNTFGTDPLRGIAGAVNPLVRVPLELLSGGSWGTGAPINDSSDYLDSSIPGVNYMANITGVSPTGSIFSALTGQGLDNQAQVDKGNKGAADQALSAFNWLSGLGVQNVSKENYVNFAEIEKRNRESEQRSGF